MSDRVFPATSTTFAAIAILLVVLAAFWPVAVGARSFFHMDLVYEHLPVWKAAQDALRSGDSPFWLDGVYCGNPPLFVQEAPLFYPLTVPLLSTGAPVHRLADLFTLFHFWLAGFAMCLLVRELTAQPAAGLFAGIAWALSARTVQSAIWPNAVAVAALAPLTLLGVLRIARGRRRSGVVCTAVAGGLALCAARPQSLLAVAPLVAALVVALWLAALRKCRALADLALAGALALALGAPSMLPTAALLPETSREGGLSADAQEPQMLAQGRELDMVFLPVDGRARWPESAAYPGVLVYGLAVFGAFLFLPRGPLAPRAAFAGAALGAVAGLALAFGDAGPYRYVANLPLLRGFRVPERFLTSWALGLVLAASIALAQGLARARHPRRWAVAALLVLAADLIPHARRAAPTAESRVYAVEPAIVPEVRARLGRDEAGFPRRFISGAGFLNVAPYPDAIRIELLREAGGLKGTLGLRYGLESAYGAGPSLARIEELLRRPTERALALGGVAVMVVRGRDASGEFSPLVPPVLRSTVALPRALLTPEAVVVPEGMAVRLTLSPQLDPRRTAVLEDGEPLEASPAWNASASSVHVLSRRPGRVALEAKLPAAGVLVLFDSWEKGWRATVDSGEAPVLRADAAFRAVRLTAGTHRVEFRYAPPGLWEGVGLGLIGILGVVLAAIRLPSDSEGVEASSIAALRRAAHATLD